MPIILCSAKSCEIIIIQAALQHHTSYVNIPLTGDMIVDLHSPQMEDDNIYDISICDDMMALACWNSVKLFKLEYSLP